MAKLRVCGLFWAGENLPTPNFGALWTNTGNFGIPKFWESTPHPVYMVPGGTDEVLSFSFPAIKCLGCTDMGRAWGRTRCVYFLEEITMRVQDGCVTVCAFNIAAGYCGLRLTESITVHQQRLQYSTACFY